MAQLPVNTLFDVPLSFLLIRTLKIRNRWLSVIFSIKLAGNSILFIVPM